MGRRDDVAREVVLGDAAVDLRAAGDGDRFGDTQIIVARQRELTSGEEAAGVIDLGVACLDEKTRQCDKHCD